MKRFATLLSAVCAPCAFAQPFSIDRHTVDGGGGTSAGGGFVLSGTIGQHDAGETMTGSGFELTGGYWAGITGSSGGRLCADVNGDGQVNGSDFFAWVNLFGNNDPLADVNQDSVVDSSDFFAWVNFFGQGQNGPICSP